MQSQQRQNVKLRRCRSGVARCSLICLSRKPESDALHCRMHITCCGRQGLRGFVIKQSSYQAMRCHSERIAGTRSINGKSLGLQADICFKDVYITHRMRSPGCVRSLTPFSVMRSNDEPSTSVANTCVCRPEGGGARAGSEAACLRMQPTQHAALDTICWCELRALTCAIIALSRTSGTGHAAQLRKTKHLELCPIGLQQGGRENGAFLGRRPDAAEDGADGVVQAAEHELRCLVLDDALSRNASRGSVHLPPVLHEFTKRAACGCLLNKSLVVRGAAHVVMCLASEPFDFQCIDAAR